MNESTIESTVEIKPIPDFVDNENYIRISPNKVIGVAVVEFKHGTNPTHYCCQFVACTGPIIMSRSSEYETNAKGIFAAYSKHVDYHIDKQASNPDVNIRHTGEPVDLSTLASYLKTPDDPNFATGGVVKAAPLPDESINVAIGQPYTVAVPASELDNLPNRDIHRNPNFVKLAIFNYGKELNKYDLISIHFCETLRKSGYSEGSIGDFCAIKDQSYYPPLDLSKDMFSRETIAKPKGLAAQAIDTLLKNKLEPK